MTYIDYEIQHLAPLAAKDRRVVRRDVDEFIGLCRGFAADGVIHDNELEALREWVERKKRLTTAPLVGEICVLAKKALRAPSDRASRAELYEAIKKLTGDIGSNGRLESTSLPLTQPVPPVAFPGQSFCFTGTFNCGSRTECEDVTVLLGGRASKYMSQSVNYLVIGATATGAWLHSTYGRKIQDAVHWNKSLTTSPIAIISEAHWVAAVNAVRPGTF